MERQRMRVRVEQLGGITGRLSAEHKFDALEPAQQQALRDLLASPPQQTTTSARNTPRYVLHIVRDGGDATVLTLDEGAMPDCLLTLALPR
jgi:hypothetical protein